MQKDQNLDYFASTSYLDINPGTQQKTMLGTVKNLVMKYTSENGNNFEKHHTPNSMFQAGLKGYKMYKIILKMNQMLNPL